MSNPIPEHVVGSRPTVHPVAAGAVTLALAALGGCSGEGGELPSTSASAPVAPVVQPKVDPSILPADAEGDGAAAASADARAEINLVDLVPNTATATATMMTRPTRNSLFRLTIAPPSVQASLQ